MIPGALQIPRRTLEKPYRRSTARLAGSDEDWMEVLRDRTFRSSPLFFVAPLSLCLMSSCDMHYRDPRCLETRSRYGRLPFKALFPSLLSSPFSDDMGLPRLAEGHWRRPSLPLPPPGAPHLARGVEQKGNTPRRSSSLCGLTIACRCHAKPVDVF